MATSGSESVAINSYLTLKFSWWFNNGDQSIEDNATLVRWKMELIADENGRISSTAKKNWSVTVNGTKYSGTNTVGLAAKETKTLASGTTTVSHNADGSKTFSYSFGQQLAITFSGKPLGTFSGSGSGTLTTIPRKSSLSVANGTLGTEQTLTVTQQATSFTHSIKAVCGTSTLYIKADGSTSTTEVKHNDCSIPFTPPLDWASQNTTGTSVKITYTITTYNGNTAIGSTDYTKSCVIHDYFMSISINQGVVDGFVYSNYNGYVQSVTKAKIKITTFPKYDATIKSYRTTIDGNTYTGSEFTTNAFKSSGRLPAEVTVTDSRGRKSTQTLYITVHAYSPPKITALTLERCNEDGTKNTSGDYLKAVFSANVTTVADGYGNEKNTATYKLSYKKTTETTYTDVTLSDYQNNYSVTNGYHIFEAKGTYNVVITATDDFTSDQKLATSKAVFKFFSFLTKGTGMAIGKIAELANVFDIGFQTRFSGGTMAIVAEKITNLDELKTPNTYISINNSATTYTGLPDGIGGTFTIEVMQAGAEGQIMQRITSCSQNYPDIRIRHYYGGKWGDWQRVGGIANIMTAHLSANLTTVELAYTKIPLVEEKRIGAGLSISDGSIKIGAGIKAVKVSANMNFKGLMSDGNRFIKVMLNKQEVSWAYDHGISGKYLSLSLTPRIIDVKRDDLIELHYYSPAADEVIQAGNSVNGYLTFLTVEVVA